MDFPKRKRRNPLELQLTTLIDIFTLIVIFLVMGTVFGAADMSVPKDMRVPRSFGKESVESAPQVVINQNEVTVVALAKEFQDQAKPIPLSEFRRGSGVATPALEPLKKLLKDHIAKLPNEIKKQGTLLNVIADRDAKYPDVFEVIRVFREAGFETLLFVAMGESLTKAGGTR
jgi:biopolymer transport protein ExbD